MSSSQPPTKIIPRKKRQYARYYEVFLFYRYKKSGAPGRYYVNAAHCVEDHEYSLSYSEWMAVIKVYMKELWLAMLSGKIIFLPYNMGRIYLCRIKRTPRKGNKVFHNLHSDGYSPLIRWRTNNKLSTYLKLFKLRFTDTTNDRIAAYYKKHPYEMLKLSDETKTWSKRSGAEKL